MILGGVKVFSSPFAERVEVTHVVVKTHPRARRRRYSVRRVETRVACALQTPMGLFVHPTIFAALVAQTEAAR